MSQQKLFAFYFLAAVNLSATVSLCLCVSVWVPVALNNQKVGAHIR